jgi:1-deoxy-D-xylulose-5-phosphate synthase
MDLLEGIKSPQNLKKIDQKRLPEVASLIRDRIISVMSRNGGHLASNLGIVDLTIAVHYVFDSPKDTVIFDVGHQCYAHKILTGRNGQFDSIRIEDGLSGYPNPSESPHDHYNTGHASTAIGLAAGEALARDFRNERRKVVAIVGDGGLTGGESYEALNFLGQKDTDVIVILNDNEMSISKSVGAVSLVTSKFRASLAYRKLSRKIGLALMKMGKFGEFILFQGMKLKSVFKKALMADQIFEQLGFKYLGPVDGHDISTMIAFLNHIKKFNMPVLLHVKTKKGKGCDFAECKPTQFHGTAPFDIENGDTKPADKSYSALFGETISRLAADDDRIVGITAAMSEGTGLSIMYEKLPEKVIDVGIAEPLAVTLGASLAKSGMKPVIAIYSTFLQRAYDQILHDVALNNLPVVFAIDRAGLVPDDGPTHQGIFDLAYLSTVPNMTLMTPSTGSEFVEMLKLALSIPAPSAIRYPKDKVDESTSEPVKFGKASLELDGSDVLLCYLGSMRKTAHKAAQMLGKENVSTAVLNMRFAKPLDIESISRHSEGKKLVVTIEEGIVDGGIGQKIAALVATKTVCIGLPDKFPDIAIRAVLIEKYGLDPASVAKKILSCL